MPSYRQLGQVPPKRHIQMEQPEGGFASKCPHGPHPGTIMKSMEMDYTAEMAVMFDTDLPLFLTEEAMKFDDPTYPYSWLS